MNNNQRRYIVLGAGVTGLTVAWQLAKAGQAVLVLEAQDHVGGMAATFRHGDFLLDLGPHKFFSLMEERMQQLEELMGDELLTVPKRSRICLSKRLLNYPLSLIDVTKNLDPFIAISGGFSYLIQCVVNLFDRSAEVSYEGWLVRRFGRRLYELIFAQYARKIWGDPKTLARSLAETRVAIPGLLPLLWHMFIARNRQRVIHAETFRYPKFGSGQFCDKLAELVIKYGGEIECSAAVREVYLHEDRVCAIEVNGKPNLAVEREDVVISTLPVGYFSRLISPALPESVMKAASQLKTRDLILLYVILNRPSVSDDNWIFFPEQKIIFNRMFEQKNFSPFMVPEGKTALCLEIVLDGEECRPSDAELAGRALPVLEELGLIRSDEVLEVFSKVVKWAYPVYDIHYQENVDIVLNALESISNLYSIGRQGGFNYVGQMDCFDMGIRTAEYLLAHADKAAWQAVRESFRHYIVLD